MTAFRRERGATAGRSGSGAARVSSVNAPNTTPIERKTSGQGSHSLADTANAPASSMPIR